MPKLSKTEKVMLILDKPLCCFECRFSAGYYKDWLDVDEHFFCRVAYADIPDNVNVDETVWEGCPLKEVKNEID